MTNLKLTSAVLLLSGLFMSCQRNYTCRCTMLPDASIEDMTIEADSKKEAKAECDKVTSLIYAGHCGLL